MKPPPPPPHDCHPGGEEEEEDVPPDHGSKQQQEKEEDDPSAEIRVLETRLACLTALLKYGSDTSGSFHLGTKSPSSSSSSSSYDDRSKKKRIDKSNGNLKDGLDSTDQDRNAHDDDDDDDDDNKEEEEDNMEDVIRQYAPPHLPEAFADLYTCLAPSLRRRHHGGGGPADDAPPRNAAAFIIGPHGTGKSLLLSRVLQACRRRRQRPPDPRYDDDDDGTFRTVHIQGFLQGGDQVALILREMLQQLSAAADRPPGDSPPSRVRKRALVENDNDDDNAPMEKTPRPAVTDHHPGSAVSHQAWRLRQTSFTNQVQLLNEILQLAALDGIPILFIWEDWEALLGGPTVAGGGSSSSSSLALNKLQADGWTCAAVKVARERQLLLYHLLDRVATPRSAVSLVATSASVHGLGNSSRLEKRIQSRAVGTARFIYCGGSARESYAAVVEAILVHVLDRAAASEAGAVTTTKDSSSSSSSSASSSSSLSSWASRDDMYRQIRQEISSLLLGGEGVENTHSADTASNDPHDNEATSVSQHQPPPKQQQQQQQQLLLYEALERQYRLGQDMRWFTGLFMYAVQLHRQECLQALQQKQKQLALSFSSSSSRRRGGGGGGVADPKSSSSSAAAPYRLQAHHFITALAGMGGGGGSCIGGLVVAPTDPRRAALDDLSGPEVALVLSAYRILSRERGGRDTGPLTGQRLLEEYRGYTGTAAGGQYHRLLLRQALATLVQRNILMAREDHTGQGPFQYRHDARLRQGLVHGRDDDGALNRPLHLLYDIHWELKPLVEERDGPWTGVPTALKEWARGRRV